MLSKKIQESILESYFKISFFSSFGPCQERGPVFASVLSQLSKALNISFQLLPFNKTCCNKTERQLFIHVHFIFIFFVFLVHI